MQPKPFQTVCIVGAGFMGGQIGLQCAIHGYQVWYVDLSEGFLQQAVQQHARELQTRLDNGQLNVREREAILERIHFTTSLPDGTQDADLVVESVPENLAVKRHVFAQLDQVCPPRTILTTNSSSLRISAIEDVTQRRDKVLNMHFFPPIWQRPMVELMRGTLTSDESMAAMQRFARSIGMTPLPVLKESTGFLFNRVWRAIKKECLTLVDEGVASLEDVDRAWMIIMGGAAGPFGMMDMIGLDVVRDIEMVYYRESSDEVDAPPRLLLDKIEKGELGVKAGKGFYTYPNPAFQEPSWLKDEPE